MPKRGKRFKNREISWLSFNARVLQEAGDKTVPLIERLRFLGIFSSNLDEFFRVRISTLRKLSKLKHHKDILGFNAEAVLNRIHKTVLSQQSQFERSYKKILSELAAEKTFIINETQLSYTQGRFVKNYFRREILPSLVPVMIEKIKDFPFLKDKSIYFVIRLMRKNNHKEKEKLALMEIPTERLPRFISLPRVGENKFIIMLDDIIRYCLQDVFYIFNYDHFDAWMVKMTRDADLDIDNDVSGSLMEKLSRGLTKRKKGIPVRFLYDANMPEYILKYLEKRIHLKEQDMIAGGRYHNFKDFIQFPNIGKSEWVYEKITPVPHKYLTARKSIIRTIKERDCILHLPYHSFTYIIQFLREASLDPKAVSIKIALYRVAQNSNIVNALINAAKNGKSVSVVMELQARFDEEANIFWAKRMEEEGIKVIYGVPDLKVHSKMFIVSRMEKGKLVHYANLGTGNYHEENAKYYSDQSLFTSNQHLTREAYRMFLYFEDGKKPDEFKHLLAAPFDFRKKLTKLLDTEIENAKAGKEAYVILKVNHIVDDKIISKLYEASHAGVKVNMIVRTTCSLVPEIKGISENIKVISIVDKFLEHARMFVFCNAGDTKYFLSSSDLMTRNLDHRLEIAFPVYDEEIKHELREIINIQLKDNMKARIINEQQSNRYRKDSSVTKVRAQVDIYNYLREHEKPE
ncbi:MAG TPA: polyphosphate kinase 1 [Bacteroidia bacterium]|nr:polyphosphate kinase 1 [Bacteroidia bacterium]